MSILITVLLCFHILFTLHKSWIAVLRIGLFIWLMPVKSQHLRCQNLWKRNYKGFRAAHHVTPHQGNWFSKWSKAYWEEWAHVRHGKTSGKGCWAARSVPLCTSPAMPGHALGRRPRPDTLSELTQSPKPQPSPIPCQRPGLFSQCYQHPAWHQGHSSPLIFTERGDWMNIHVEPAVSTQLLVWGSAGAAPCWT